MSALPTDLTTLANVKTFLGQTTTAADIELQQLISGVTQSMYLEAGLQAREDGEPPSLFEDTYKERYHGLGGSSMLLRWSPIVKVTALTIDDTLIPAAKTARESGYVWDRFAVWVRGYVFTRGIRNVGVTYTAGVDPNGTLAKSLELETIELVAAMFKGKKYLHIQSEKLGDQMITYARQAMPDRVRELLMRIGPKMAVA